MELAQVVGADAGQGAGLGQHAASTHVAVNRGGDEDVPHKQNEPRHDVLPRVHFREDDFLDRVTRPSRTPMLPRGLSLIGPEPQQLAVDVQKPRARNAARLARLDEVHAGDAEPPGARHL